MKFTHALVLAVATLSSSTTTTAFVLPSQPSGTIRTLQAATVDETTTAVAREAPGAGKKPAWENRPGLPPSEYMASDMSKPDLSGMWECPLTRWDYEG